MNFSTRITLSLLTALLISACDEGGGKGKAASSAPVLPPVIPTPTPGPAIVANFLINSGATHTNNALVQLSITAVADEMYISTDSNCLTGGTWVPFATPANFTLPQLNHKNDLYLRLRSTAGYSQCLPGSIIHDDVAPLLAVIQPSGSGYINSSTVGNYVISGTCSEEGRGVHLTGATQAQTTCTSGSYQFALDLASVGDGSVQLAVAHQDVAGNSVSVALPVLTKVTAAVTGSLTIHNNITHANLSSVALDLQTNTGTEMYLTSIATCNLGGSWAPFVAQSSFVLPAANSINNIYIQYRDPAGNLSPCYSQSVTHDNIPPSLSLASPTENSYINIGNQTNLSFSGTCSEEGSSVVLGGSGGGTILCSGGNFVGPINLSSAADGNVSVTLTEADLAGNSTQITRNLIKDTIAPAVAVTAPLEGAVVNSTGIASVTLSGTCSESGRPVVLSGALSLQLACNSGAWTTTANLSSQSDGILTINVATSDAAGNLATVTRNITKDTLAPTSPAIQISSGAIAVNVTAVTLQISATDATEMYVTNTAGCGSGGVWEAYAATKAWTLPTVNATNNIYIKFRDAALNVSACVSDSIIHDSVVPTWSTVPTHAAYGTSLTDSPSVTYSANATDTGSGIDHYEIAIGTGTTGAAASDKKAWATAGVSPVVVTGLALTNATAYRVNMRAVDKAGNVRMLNSTVFTVDVVPPNLTVTSPLNNSAVSFQEFAFTGACETGRTISITYSSDVTGPATATCTSSAYRFVVRFSGSTGPRTVMLMQADLATNSTTKVINLNYVNRIHPGGPVYAVVGLPDGSEIWGGSFSYVYTNPSLGIARIDSSGNFDSTFNSKSGFNGDVYASVGLADGSVIVGGAFTSYRGILVNRIAKILASGDLDLTFNAAATNVGANGVIRSLALSGSNLYVGGDFTTYRGSTFNRFVKLDAATGLAIAGFGGTGFNNRVYTIYVANSNIYIGGTFTTYQGVAYNRIVKVAEGTAVADTIFSPATNGFNNTVRTIVADASNVYVGGDFTTYRGVAQNYLAKLASDGSVVTFPAANASIYALAIDGTAVYMGGTVTTLGGVSVNRIAKASLAGTVDSTFSTATIRGFNSTVTSLLLNGSNLYAGGIFSTYRGATANRFAKIDITNGSLDVTVSPALGLNGADNYIYSMALANGKIYLLGSLTSYRNQYMANNLVKIDPDGNVDTTFSVQVSNSGCDNIVRALAINDYHVFVGGDFVKCRGVSANRVAKLDLLTGAVDTMDFNPSASNGVNGVVRAVLVSNNDVYIGGDFTTYRGVTVNRIVKTNLLGAVDSTFKGSGTVGITSANTGVYALAINGSSLYVGGSFTLYRGATVARLLKLNTSDGSSDATFATTGANSTILSLAVANSSLYVGGAFTSFKGQAMNYLAKASLSDASPDLTFKSALATTGTNRNVNAIYSDGSFLYVGGTFTAYRGTTTNCMMAVDHSTGDPDTTFRSVGGITGSTVSINSISSRGDGTVTFGGNMMLYGGQVSPMIVTVGVNGVAN